MWQNRDEMIDLIKVILDRWISYKYLTLEILPLHDKHILSANASLLFHPQIYVLLLLFCLGLELQMSSDPIYINLWKQKLTYNNIMVRAQILLTGFNLPHFVAVPRHNLDFNRLQLWWCGLFVLEVYLASGSCFD